MGKRQNLLKVFRPPCYYCDRRFANEQSLILHQKSVHFNCMYCRRRLDNATGLAIHWLQVHKRNLSEVPEALPERAALTPTVRGLSGVPPEIIETFVQADIRAANERKSSARAAVSNAYGAGLIEITEKGLFIKGVDPSSELFAKTKALLDAKLSLSQKRRRTAPARKTAAAGYGFAEWSRANRYAESGPGDNSNYHRPVIGSSAAALLDSACVIKVKDQPNVRVIWKYVNVSGRCAQPQLSPEEVRACKLHKVSLIV